MNFREAQVYSAYSHNVSFASISVGFDKGAAMSQGLKVLQIYQGNNYSKFSGAVQDAVLQAQHVPYKVTDSPPNFGAHDIYTRCRRAIIESDACIAVLTRDGRDASKAGNLWLEVGLWLGLKRADNLLLLLEDARNVEAPSDIPGYVSNRIKEPSDVSAPITRFLTNITLLNQAKRSRERTKLSN